MKKNLTSLSSYLTYFSKKRKKKLNQTKKRLAHRFSKLSGENTNSNPCGVIPYAEPLLTYSLCRRKCIKCWHTVNASIFTHHIEQPKTTNEIYIFPTTLYIFPMKLYIFFKKIAYIPKRIATSGESDCENIYTFENGRSKYDAFLVVHHWSLVIFVSIKKKISTILL